MVLKNQCEGLTIVENFKPHTAQHAHHEPQTVALVAQLEGAKKFSAAQ